ncbi:MAG: MipA/OmpV family protein, partial [Steroidobacteraceae bacterium]
MQSSLRIGLALLTLAAAGSPQVVAAQAPCKSASAECVAVGELDITVSVGYGTRTNPIGGKSDIPLFAIPSVSYYGKRFFLESLEPGFTLYEGNAHTLNVIATPGYDRVFFSRNDPQNIIVNGAFSPLVEGAPPFAAPPPEEGAPPEEVRTHRRRTAYFVGPEWLFTHRRFIGQLNALYEVTGRHDGYELRAAVSAPLIKSHNSLIVSGGGTWKSAETVDYYYGVRGLYAAGSAFCPF